jgi:hypothetical protein
MSIRRAIEETEVRAGHWVHGASNLQYGQHSEPRQVTRIAGKRVHYKRLDGTESFMLRSAVLMVCDTEAEASAVHTLSEERSRAVGNQVRRILEDADYNYGVLLNALIEGAA